MINFLTPKARCNICGDLVVSKSSTKFTECSCGNLKIMGTGTFKVIQGKDYTDLTDANEDKLPPRK